MRTDHDTAPTYIWPSKPRSLDFKRALELDYRRPRARGRMAGRKIHVECRRL